jgi:hypothetical protein
MKISLNIQQNKIFWWYAELLTMKPVARCRYRFFRELMRTMCSLNINVRKDAVCSLFAPERLWHRLGSLVRLSVYQLNSAPWDVFAGSANSAGALRSFLSRSCCCHGGLSIRPLVALALVVILGNVVDGALNALRSRAVVYLHRHKPLYKIATGLNRYGTA